MGINICRNIITLAINEIQWRVYGVRIHPPLISTNARQILCFYTIEKKIDSYKVISVEDDIVAEISYSRNK